MTSSHSPEPLVLEVRPSLRLRVWLLAGALAAVSAVALAVGANPFLWSLAGAILSWYWLAQRRLAGDAGWLRLDGGQWGWRGAVAMPWRPLRLRRSVCWPWLVVLEFDDAGRRQYRLLFTDSCGRDGNRRLRVLLRHASSLD